MMTWRLEEYEINFVARNLSKLLFERRRLCGFRVSECLSFCKKKNFLMVAHIKQARKGFRPISGSQIFLGSYKQFLGNFWEFFLEFLGNSLGIL